MSTRTHMHARVRTTRVRMQSRSRSRVYTHPQVGEVVPGKPAVVLHDAKALSFAPTALSAAVGGELTITGTGFFKGDKW